MGMYAVGELGATDPRLAWEAAIHARGGTVTSWPSTIGGVKQSNAGKLAARVPNESGAWVFELPPFSISAQDRIDTAQRAATIAAGKAAAVGESVAKGILDAPRNAIAAVTGIPRWLVPVLLIGGGLFFAANKLGLDLTGVGRRFARNPRGRRVRRRRHASPRARRRRRG